MCTANWYLPFYKFLAISIHYDIIQCSQLYVTNWKWPIIITGFSTFERFSATLGVILALLKAVQLLYKLTIAVLKTFIQNHKFIGFPQGYELRNYVTQISSEKREKWIWNITADEIWLINLLFGICFIFLIILMRLIACDNML